MHRLPTARVAGYFADSEQKLLRTLPTGEPQQVWLHQGWDLEVAPRAFGLAFVDPQVAGFII